MKLGNNQFEKITVKILKQRIEQNSKLKYLNCDYENQNSKVLLRCECGREFTCAYRKLRENNYRTRCEHCRREIANKNRAITTENRFREFVKNNSEDELVEYYNSRECCVFKCHRCGKEYKMRSDTFRDGSRCSCDLNSKGARRIVKYLEENNIPYELEKTFEGCRSEKGYLLRFDFYIETQNVTIEFDGEFHYKEMELRHQNLKYQQNCDEIKNEFCEKEKIKLIRIPYWEIDNVEIILSKSLNQL